MTEYTLYYWPLPFRGHFIRYLLAQSGAIWDEPGVDAVTGLKSRSPEAQPYPFMAPPLLVDHAAKKSLSQMPAILIYLARKHALTGDPDRALRLVADASDILFEITRYHGALMWDDVSWAAFAEYRLPRWMELHERLVTEAGVGKDVAFLDGGETPCLGDLVLAALWHTMSDCLPPLAPMLAQHAPHTADLSTRVAETKPIAALRQSWKTDDGARYCGGRIESSLMDVLGI